MLKSQLPHKKSSKISKLLKSKNSSIFLNSTRLYAPSISINALRAREEPVFCSCSIWKDAISKAGFSPASLLSLLSLSLSLLLSLQSMMMCNIGLSLVLLYLELVSEEEDFGFRGRATIVHGGH